MNVSNLLESKFGSQPDTVVSCTVDNTVAQAIEKMVHHKIGAIVVLNNENVVGVFSERDVLRLSHLDAIGFGAVMLSDAMSKNVVGIAPHRPVEDALQLMKEHSIRHLTVMENDQLVGFISLRDLMMYKIEYAKQVSDFMRSQIVSGTDPLPM